MEEEAFLQLIFLSSVLFFFSSLVCASATAIDERAFPPTKHVFVGLTHGTKIYRLDRKLQSVYWKSIASGYFWCFLTFWIIA